MSNQIRYYAAVTDSIKKKKRLNCNDHFNIDVNINAKTIND